MTPEQEAALDVAQKSVAGCNALAIKMEAQGLNVLASFLREASTVIRVGIERQGLALNDFTKQAEVIADTMERRGLFDKKGKA